MTQSQTKAAQTVPSFAQLQRPTRVIELGDDELDLRELARTEDLRGVKFTGTLGFPYLQGLDLRGADFSAATLIGAQFQGARLGGANFSGAVLSRVVASCCFLSTQSASASQAA